jgi:hypothetical protein
MRYYRWTFFIHKDGELQVVDMEVYASSSTNALVEATEILYQKYVSKGWTFDDVRHTSSLNREEWE